MTNNEQYLRDLWDTNIHIKETQKEKREKKREIMSERTMSKNFPKLVKTICISRLPPGHINYQRAQKKGWG